MSEQPNCCPACQTRLDIIETVMIEDEVIQVNYCEECGAEILMIDEDVD
jgi:Zn ribbon nucleic-acid-binding protein